MHIKTQAHLVVHDLPIGFHQRLCIERSLAVQHFIHADAEGPPVALRSILALPILHGLEDFWGDVVWSPYRHRGLDLTVPQNRCQEKNPKFVTRETKTNKQRLTELKYYSSACMIMKVKTMSYRLGSWKTCWMNKPLLQQQQTTTQWAYWTFRFHFRMNSLVNTVFTHCWLILFQSNFKNEHLILNLELNSGQ